MPFDAHQEVDRVRKWSEDIIHYIEAGCGCASVTHAMLQVEAMRRASVHDPRIPYPFKAVAESDNAIAQCINDTCFADYPLLAELEDTMRDMMRQEELERQEVERLEAERLDREFWSSPAGYLVWTTRIAMFWSFVVLVVCIMWGNGTCTFSDYTKSVVSFTFVTQLLWMLTPDRY